MRYDAAGLLKFRDGAAGFAKRRIRRLWSMVPRAGRPGQPKAGCLASTVKLFWVAVFAPRLVTNSTTRKLDSQRF